MTIKKKIIFALLFLACVNILLLVYTISVLKNTENDIASTTIIPNCSGCYNCTKKLIEKFQNYPNVEAYVIHGELKEDAVNSSQIEILRKTNYCKNGWCLHFWVRICEQFECYDIESTTGKIISTEDLKYYHEYSIIDYATFNESGKGT